MTAVDPRARSPDLRLPALGGAAWAAVAATFLGPLWVVAAGLAVLAAAAGVTRRPATIAIALAFATGATCET